MAGRRKRFSNVIGDGSGFATQSLGLPTRASNLASSGVPGGSQIQNVKRKTYSVAGPPKSNVAFGRQTGVGPGSSMGSRLSVGSRPSVASRLSAGRSSVMGSSGSIKKDPRPLSDKAYQKEMVKRLKEFLEENNYRSTNLSLRQLQTPTTKEFFTIFNFLLDMIDPSLPLDGLNLVEEVPATLKMLGYPFTVSKNHMLNVGSPHSWPVLLGAINWLIDCCNVAPNNTTQILFRGEDDFASEDDKREYQIEEVLYHAYMEHGDDSAQYQGMIGEWRDSVNKQCVDLEEEVAKKKEENAKLAETVAELSKSSLSSLSEKVQQNKADIEQMTYHLQSEVIPAITDLRQQTADTDAHASEVEMQILASREKVQKLEEQIRQQPMSAMDAHALHQSIKDAEDMLEMKRDQQEVSTRRIAELQMLHNKSVQQIYSLCQKVNGNLLQLAAVLPDAASLTPLDYETSNRANPGVLKKLTDDAQLLKDQVQELHRGVSRNITEYEGQLISADDAQRTLQSELARKKLEVESVQHNLDTAREALSKKRQFTEEVMKRELVEKQALEKSLRALELRQGAKSSSEKEYLRLKQQHEAEIAEMERKVERENIAFQELLKALTDFITVVKAHDVGIGKQFSELMKEFKELKFPTVPAQFLTPFDPNTD